MTGCIEDIDVEEISESDLILGELGGEVERPDGDVLRESVLISSR